MTPILLALTVASLIAFAALLAYVVRLKREARERSEARVAALAARLATAGIAAPDFGAGPVGDSRGTNDIVDAALDAAADFDAASVDADAGNGALAAKPLFGANAGPASPGQRLLLPLAGLLVAILALGAIYATTRATPEAATTTMPSTLELLSLRHRREGETLTIAGLARNAPGSRTLDDVTAVVVTYGRDGTQLARARGVLDQRRLAPGESAPFVVRLPGAGDVARYRVSFTNEAGTVPHFDRRAEPPGVPPKSGQQED